MCLQGDQLLAQGDSTTVVKDSLLVVVVAGISRGSKVVVKVKARAMVVKVRVQEVDKVASKLKCTTAMMTPFAR